jgi:hypothetical protein
MFRESKAHVGEGFRRMKLRKKTERPSSFYRAPEIQERGRSLERDSSDEGIGLGISTPDEQKIPDKPSREWPDEDEDMTEDPKIQNYSSRRPRVMVRRNTPKGIPIKHPRYGDPVVAVEEVLMHGGVLLPVGREGDGLLLRVSTDQVRAVREKRRREREGTSTAGRAAIGTVHEPCYLRDSRLTWRFTEKEEHDRELDQFVADFEQLQRETHLESEEAEEHLDQYAHAEQTDFEGVANTDGTQDTSPSPEQPAVDTPQHSYVFESDSDSESDVCSLAGSDTSVRTAFRSRDGNRTPRPGDIGTSNSPGKSHWFIAHPLPPVPTFPPSDLFEPSHPDDHEEFVSLNDPSITKHLAHALRNIYSGDMAAQNPAMANSAAPYTLGGNMPSAGHHSDMQHIWTLVQELSSVLQQNREHYDELQDGLTRAQVILDYNDMGKMLGWLTHVLLDKTH